METTKFTIKIEYSLVELKKAYAFYMGEKDWKKIKKSDVANWIANLASADVQSDMDTAIESFE